MGAKGSKDSTKAQEAQLDISTVSMALDSHAKSRLNKDSSSLGSVPPNQIYPMAKYSSAHSQPPTVNISSVRFSGSMDQNGNHFYPNSLGKNSMGSSTNADEDLNNNTVHCDKGTASKVSLKGKSDKAPSHRSESPANLTDQSGTPNPSHYTAVVVPEKRHKMNRRESASGRKSGTLFLVFFVELLSLAGLAVLAYLLRFTNTFEVILSCARFNRPDIDYPKEPSINGKIIFGDLSSRTFYLIFLLVPIGLILVFEIFRQFILIGLAHSSANESVRQKKLGIPVAVYIRRIVRFTGGFLFGSLMTSVLVDVLKYQTGEPRPYFYNITCGNFTTHYCLDGATPESSCPDTSKEDLKDARMSFPSMTAGMSFYAAVFLVLYLSFALPYRGARFLRVWLILGIAFVTVLTFNARLSTNQNHVWDMVVGLFIGLFFALYIVFIHLNAFANRLSSSNFLGANRSAKDGINTVEGQLDTTSQFDEVSHSDIFAENDKPDWFQFQWKNFHIPRVHTLRQSARNMLRRTDNSSRPAAADQLSNNTSRANHKLSNAYINPAFNGRDDSILSNHLHQDGSRLTARESFNSRNSNNTNNYQRNTLRTFQANS